MIMKDFWQHFYLAKPKSDMSVVDVRSDAMFYACASRMNPTRLMSAEKLDIVQLFKIRLAQMF